MEKTHPQPNYMAVFYGLIALTAVELWIAKQTVLFGRQTVIASLVILAFVKAAMVALWYMHLKFEKWLVYGICAVPCVLVCVLLAGTMPDIGRPKEIEPYFGPPRPRTHETPMQREIAPAASEESKAPATPH